MENKIKINDVVLNYFDNQNQQKPVVIMLHGWGQNYQCFLPLIEKLNKNYHIFALDLPGFGKSEEPNFPYTIYDYANCVLAFIKELEIKEYNLVSHSFGGRISIILANQDQDHVKKMVLTGAAGIKPKKTWRQKLSVYHYKFMKLLTKTPIFCQWHKDLITNSGSPDYRKASPMMKQVLINTVNEDLTPLLDNINQEVLLYWGDDDDQTPLMDGMKMEARMQNAKLIHVPNHGHFAFVTNGPNFTSYAAKFLEN